MLIFVVVKVTIGLQEQPIGTERPPLVPGEVHRLPGATRSRVGPGPRPVKYGRSHESLVYPAPAPVAVESENPKNRTRSQRPSEVRESI